MDPEPYRIMLVRFYIIHYNTKMSWDLFNNHGYHFQLLGNYIYYNILGGAWVVAVVYIFAWRVGGSNENRTGSFSQFRYYNCNRKG